MIETRIVAIGHFVAVAGGELTFKADEGDVSRLFAGETVMFAVQDDDGKFINAVPSLEVSPVYMLADKAVTQ